MGFKIRHENWIRRVGSKHEAMVLIDDGVVMVLGGGLMRSEIVERDWGVGGDWLHCIRIHHCLELKWDMVVVEEMGFIRRAAARICKLIQIHIFNNLSIIVHELFLHARVPEILHFIVCSSWQMLRNLSPPARIWKMGFNYFFMQKYSDYCRNRQFLKKKRQIV